MKDDVSVMVVLAAERGETKILKYLLSSYGDLIDINRQDQVINFIFTLLVLVVKGGIDV